MTIFDAIIGMIFILVFMMVALLGVFIHDEMNAEPAFSEELGENTQYFNTTRAVTLSFDGLSVIIMGGIMVVTVLSAFLIRSHPAFFIISFITLIFAIGLSAVFANIWYEISSTDELATTANEFTVTTTLFNLLPYIALGLSAIIAVVMHGKPQSRFDASGFTR